jgi:hypothetical protein
MIGTGDLLLVVPHLSAIPVSVLYVGLYVKELPLKLRKSNT